MAKVTFMGLVPACATPITTEDTTAMMKLTKQQLCELYWKSKTFTVDSTVGFSPSCSWHAKYTGEASSTNYSGSLAVSGSIPTDPVTAATVETDLLCYKPPLASSIALTASKTPSASLEPNDPSFSASVALGWQHLYTDGTYFYIVPNISVGIYDNDDNVNGVPSCAIVYFCSQNLVTSSTSWYYEVTGPAPDNPDQYYYYALGNVGTASIQLSSGMVTCPINALFVGHTGLFPGPSSSPGDFSGTPTASFSIKLDVSSTWPYDP